jgi:Carboxypeptidase regulatory-like domain
MLGKLGCLVIVLGLTAPVWAGGQPGSISGYVRSSSGEPQMGAVVEVLGSAAHALRVFTDEKGFYSAEGLLPGVYKVRVFAPAFLPALRERVGLRPGATMVVNVTLSTLFDAVDLAPLRTPADQDDWNWVLRSVANRPILRVLDDPAQPQVAKSSEDNNHNFKGSLSFLAGSSSQGFGGTSDVSTGFSVERSLFSSETVALRGNLGYGVGSPAAIVRASLTHRMSNGSTPEVAFTLRSLPAPDGYLRNASLQALALTTSDDVALGNVVELKFGSELQTIQFMGRANAFRPFGSVNVHLSPNTILAYGYASSEPNTREEKGFESAPADLSESGPRMTIAGFTPAVERSHHQEVSISQRMGSTSLQFAVYADRIADPALTGLGEVSGDTGDVLSDPYSGTFSYQGKDLDTHGVRMVLQRKMTSDLTATLDYGYGGVLDLDTADASLQDARQHTLVRNRQSLAGKVSGTVPGSKAKWIASYRWVSGPALTPVDMFNASPGETDPFLSFFLRQPIPGTSFLPCHMDVLIDIRNLLAQGYVPVMGDDGHTVYLVQSARSVRGGVAFTF